MSSTTRSTASASTSAGSRAARSPTSSVQPSGAAPKNASTFARAIAAKSARRSYDSSRPLSPTARSSAHASAPDPTPASTTYAPGEDVAHGDDLAGVLRVHDRCPARHRQHVVRVQRAQREVLDATGAAHHDALGRADEVVVRDRALVGVEVLAGFEHDGVHAALGVRQLHPLPRPQQPSAHGGQPLTPGPARAARPRSRAPRTPRPSRSTTRYSVAGCASSASMSRGPLRSAVSTSPGTSGRATSPVATHGRRSTGVADTAASLTIPVALPVPSTTTSAAAPAASQLAQRLGQRRRRRHGDRRSDQVAQRQQRQPSAERSPRAAPAPTPSTGRPRGTARAR